MTVYDVTEASQELRSCQEFRARHVQTKRFAQAQEVDA